MILQKTSDISYIPKKIISLVPSQTELLFDLGLEAKTVGITKFCIHPGTWFRTKDKVGGTKTLHINKIKRLQPDLIIANKEENVKEQIEELALDYPVWVTDVNNLADALQMIADIGTITGKTETASTICKNIEQRFDRLQPTSTAIKTAYLIWQKPYMSVGGDTFIHDMMQRCGFQNIFTNTMRYPATTISELQTKNSKLVLLSSEPYPFKQQHINELQKQLPNVQIILVDGEMFSWYGSRLQKSAAYFEQLINQIQTK